MRPSSLWLSLSLILGPYLHATETPTVYLAKNGWKLEIGPSSFPGESYGHSELDVHIRGLYFTEILPFMLELVGSHKKVVCNRATSPWRKRTYLRLSLTKKRDITAAAEEAILALLKHLKLRLTVLKKKEVAWCLSIKDPDKLCQLMFRTGVRIKYCATPPIHQVMMEGISIAKLSQELSHQWNRTIITREKGEQGYKFCLPLYGFNSLRASLLSYGLHLKRFRMHRAVWYVDKGG
ncbi:MAG: hypothetical protein AAFR61_13885 [Bacteroidota bacterium]